MQLVPPDEVLLVAPTLCEAQSPDGCHSHSTLPLWHPLPRAPCLTCSCSCGRNSWSVLSCTSDVRDVLQSQGIRYHLVFGKHKCFAPESLVWSIKAIHHFCEAYCAMPRICARPTSRFKQGMQQCTGLCRTPCMPLGQEVHAALCPSAVHRHRLHVHCTSPMPVTMWCAPLHRCCACVRAPSVTAQVVCPTALAHTRCRGYCPLWAPKPRD